MVEMRDEVLFINGKPAEYDNPTQVKERTEGGGTTTGIRTTERIAGSERTPATTPAISARSRASS